LIVLLVRFRCNALSARPEATGGLTGPDFAGKLIFGRSEELFFVEICLFLPIERTPEPETLFPGHPESAPDSKKISF
jgi:hypothetical protein